MACLVENCVILTTMQDLQELVCSGFSNWEQFPTISVKTYDDLILFTYNQNAVKIGTWNWFERVARGLLLHRKTGEVISRAFDKFFNWHETCPVPRMSSNVENQIANVYEKLDGSLGYLFRWQGKFRFGTLGSLTSPQAVWATEYFNTHYLHCQIPPEYTLT